jgi:hypothetical protein
MWDEVTVAYGEAFVGICTGAKKAPKSQDTNNGRRTEPGIRGRKFDRSVTVFIISTWRCYVMLPFLSTVSCIINTLHLRIASCSSLHFVITWKEQVNFL